ISCWDSPAAAPCGTSAGSALCARTLPLQTALPTHNSNQPYLRMSSPLRAAIVKKFKPEQIARREASGARHPAPARTAGGAEGGAGGPEVTGARDRGLGARVQPSPGAATQPSASSSWEAQASRIASTESETFGRAPEVLPYSRSIRVVVKVRTFSEITSRSRIHRPASS